MDDVSDQQIRDEATKLTATETYTNELHEELIKLCLEIDTSVARALQQMDKE